MIANELARRDRDCPVDVRTILESQRVRYMVEEGVLGCLDGRLHGNVRLISTEDGVYNFGRIALSMHEQAV